MADIQQIYGRVFRTTTINEELDKKNTRIG